jgi:hypothetical protein
MSGCALPGEPAEMIRKHRCKEAVDAVRKALEERHARQSLDTGRRQVH